MWRGAMPVHSPALCLNIDACCRSCLQARGFPHRCPFAPALAQGPADLQCARARHHVHLRRGLHPPVRAGEGREHEGAGGHGGAAHPLHLLLGRQHAAAHQVRHADLFAVQHRCTAWPWAGGALEGKGPRRRPPEPLNRRLEEDAKAVGGGYCRLQMRLKPALGVRGTVAGHRLGPLEGGGGRGMSHGGGVPPPSPKCPWSRRGRGRGRGQGHGQGQWGWHGQGRRPRRLLQLWSAFRSSGPRRRPRPVSRRRGGPCSRPRRGPRWTPPRGTTTCPATATTPKRRGRCVAGPRPRPWGPARALGGARARASEEGRPRAVGERQRVRTPKDVHSFG